MDSVTLAMGKTLAYLVSFLIIAAVYLRYVVLGLLTSGSDLNIIGAGIAAVGGIYGAFILMSWMIRDIKKTLEKEEE